MDNTKPQRSVARIAASLPLFCFGALLGVSTTWHLWMLYSPFYHGMRGSFGFVFNFGFFRLYEPWSSCFVLVCAASFIWAGCSLLREPGSLRLGAIVGTVCFVIFAIVFIGAW
jgi:hypothetical protein